MKLYIRKSTEIVPARLDVICFQSSGHDVGIAHAKVGNFDSTPYEPTYQTWSYRAELHEATGTLWAILREYDKTVIRKAGKVVVDEDEKETIYVSRDQGATWEHAEHVPALALNAETQRDHVEST